eukprot:jgi/Bigna1/67464/fgenesh1_pg.3_\
MPVLDAVVDTGSDMLLLPMKYSQNSAMQVTALPLNITLASLFLDGEVASPIFCALRIRLLMSVRQNHLIAHTCSLSASIRKEEFYMCPIALTSSPFSSTLSRGFIEPLYRFESERISRSNMIDGRSAAGTVVPVGFQEPNTMPGKKDVGIKQQRRGILGLAPVKPMACNFTQRIGFVNHVFQQQSKEEEEEECSNKISLDLRSGLGKMGHLRFICANNQDKGVAISGKYGESKEEGRIVFRGKLVCPPATGRCESEKDTETVFRKGGCELYDIREEHKKKVLYGNPRKRFCTCGFLGGATTHYLLHVTSRDVPHWNRDEGGGYLMIDTGTTYSALPFGESVVIGDRIARFQTISDGLNQNSNLTLSNVMDISDVMPEPPQPSPLNAGKLGILGYRDLLGKKLIFDLDAKIFEMYN